MYTSVESETLITGFKRVKYITDFKVNNNAKTKTIPPRAPHRKYIIEHTQSSLKKSATWRGVPTRPQ